MTTIGNSVFRPSAYNRRYLILSLYKKMCKLASFKSEHLDLGLSKVED